MKNLQKGFVMPLLIAIIALLVVGVGVYMYKNKKAEAPAVADNGTQQTNTHTSPVNINSNLQVDTSNWKTYRNEKYGFEVKFPSDLVLQKNTGETDIYFSGKLAGKSYDLNFGYISQSELNTMGVSYCEAHPDDSRCENFTVDNLQFLIDWNIETEGAFTASRAEILKPEGGIIVIIILHSPSQDIKSLFHQILSTFKFIEPTAGTSNSGVAFCSQKFEDCPAGSVIQCNSKNGEVLYKVTFCPDQPERYLNSNGATVAECGGMPLPTGGTYESSPLCREITCASEALVQCKR